MRNAEKTAKCGGCQEWVKRRDFYPSAIRPNGLQPQCKECQRLWYLRNRLPARTA